MGYQRRYRPPRPPIGQQKLAPAAVFLYLLLERDPVDSVRDVAQAVRRDRWSDGDGEEIVNTF
jgi:hypothetical protein